MNALRLLPIRLPLTPVSAVSAKPSLRPSRRYQPEHLIFVVALFAQWEGTSTK
jgi:hypothetical protein